MPGAPASTEEQEEDEEDTDSSDDEDAGTEELAAEERWLLAGSNMSWRSVTSWTTKRCTLVYNLLLNVSQVESLGGLVVCGYVGHCFSRSVQSVANYLNSRNMPPWPLPTTGCLPAPCL
eukprot:EG_transcript_46673